MPIFRFIIIGLAVWLAISLIRRLYRSRKPAARPAPPRYVDMVSCRQCGVHVPRSQALTQGKHYYCSPQHRDTDRDTDREPH